MEVTIQVPGSKSIANRALILSAISKGTTVLQNFVFCEDSKEMIKALKKIGIKIKTDTAQNKVTVQGCSGFFPKSPNPIQLNTGNAGTTTRFITALAAYTQNHLQLTGSSRMKNRPIKPLIDSLKNLGANIESTKDFLPLTFTPSTMVGGKISLPGNISSQYLSALLLTSTLNQKTTTISIVQKLCSKPYIEMTLKLLNIFKASVSNNKFKQFKIEPKTLMSPTHLTIESDLSSASYPAAFAALNPGIKLKLQNITKNSIQGDIEGFKLLEKMGTKITHQKTSTTVSNTKPLKSLKEVDMNSCPDLVMTFAVLTMFTKGTTKIKNISNLRIKETDRLKALQNEISKFDIEVNIGKSFIKVEGDPDQLASKTQKRIRIKTYNDHRIAMCFGILKNKFPNLTIENPSCVNKSYPTFWKDLQKLTASLK